MKIASKITTVFITFIAIILLIHSPLLAQTSWDGYTLSSQDQVTQDRFRADWPNYPGGGDGRWIFERNKELEALGWIGPNSGPGNAVRPDGRTGNNLTAPVLSPEVLAKQKRIEDLKNKFKKFNKSRVSKKVDEVFHVNKVDGTNIENNVTNVSTKEIVNFLETRLRPNDFWNDAQVREDTVINAANDLFNGDMDDLAYHLNSCDKNEVILLVKKVDPSTTSKVFDEIKRIANKMANNK